MSAAEEFDPKKRLVGAGVLIGLAVVVLPAILDGDEALVPEPILQEAEGITALENNYVSSEEEVTVFVSKITPIKTPTIGVDNGTVSSKSQDSLSTANVTDSANTIDRVASDAVASLQVVQADSRLDQSTAIERGWAVRVGTFADVENVQKVLVDLTEKGFSPNSESIDTSNGKATRIWIGPYEQRVEAVRVRARLEQQTGEPGLITAFP